MMYHNYGGRDFALNPLHAMANYSSPDILISIYLISKNFKTSHLRAQCTNCGNLYIKNLRRASTCHLESKYCD